ncbi:hypothetical protein BH11PLA1_BH11PLA1_23200 [soil metagenome]
MISIFDRDGRWIYANAAVAKFAGRQIADLMGKTLTDILPADFAEDRAAVLLRVVQSGDPCAVVTRLMGGCLECTYRPVMDALGVPTCILAVGRWSPMRTGARGSPRPAPNPHETVTASTSEGQRVAQLTPRELEVLKMIGQGMSTQQVAGHLFRTVKTIEAHRAALGRKLGVSNRVQLARIAIQAGLVPYPGDESPLSARLKDALTNAALG